jgi:serine/threonine protein phosphatase PrpC
MSVVAIPDVVAIDIAGQCDRGRVREENQSMVRRTSTRLGDLLVVSDGIGNNARGVQMARMAMDTISSSVEGMPGFFPPEIAVEEAVCHANAAIMAAAAEPGCPAARMGARVVVALLRAIADRGHAPVQAIIGHVGDSRAYLIHNRKLARLTRDHSRAHDLPGSKGIMPQEAIVHPYESMLTRYLGRELNVQVEMHEVPLDFGDALLLCTHGLWGSVSEPEIERILAGAAGSADEASRALLNRVRDAGGRDSVAIEIARLPQIDSTVPASAVEPQSEAPPQVESAREFAPARDTSQSDWPVSRSTIDGVDSLEPESARRKRVLSLIGGLGKHTSDKDAMVEKPATEEPAAHSDSGALPAVAWETPAPITYGTPLSPLELNATSSVQGKFVYTPGPGYILSAGMHTLWVTFHAVGSLEDNPVLASVSITVSQATPSIQWPTPSHIPPGVALGAAQLNASASVPGAFEYSPAAGEVLSDGTHTLSVTFTPKDRVNYTTAQASVQVTVAKAVPEIDWVSPGPIPYGTPLSAGQLNALASVPGTFEYSPAAGEVLPAGSHTLSVTFTPADEMSFASTQASVPLTVTRGTPTIAWPAPERITYGVALSDAQLNATASVPGTFVYTPGPGAVLAAGEHTPSLVFTPSNLSDYTAAQAVVPLIVARATPAISWLAPQPINSATPLSAVQLNANASVPGTFVYTPAAGETLAPGVHTLSATFTPADSLNYTVARASISLTVTEIVSPVITWESPRCISYGTALGDEQFRASSSVSGSFLYAPSAGDVLPPGEHALSVIFTPEDQERYAKAHATVVIIVEGLPDAAVLLRPASRTPLASGVTAPPAAAVAAADDAVTRKDVQPVQEAQRETRTYKGAIYEKGDDGQWHLQRK